MKRWHSLLLGLALLLTMTACGGPAASAQPPTMALRPAQLSEQEQNLYELLKGEGSTLLLEYAVDDTVRSLSVNSYELGEDGSWEPVSGGSQAIDSPTGRIALRFEYIPNGMWVATQDKSGTSSIGNTALEQVDFADMTSTGSAILSQEETVVYGKEIPVALQIATTKDTMELRLDRFERPEEYRALGYEHVYVVTVAFSQEELS